ncbi:MAG TPA: TadE/TadG family type IV pilus assembly protein [Thermohalobaculum sp.]|nr:TadE/TadG family type IV pilus assembly protein [Thermohalobaculum sp.]
MERFGSKAVLSQNGYACPGARRSARNPARNPARNSSRGLVRGFLDDEHGSATIEFVLWVPVFAVILVAAIDATILYLHHTEMWNVSRDVARRVAVGDITEDQAAEVVEQELFLYSSAYFVGTSDPKDLDVQIMIQTQVADASVFGFFEPILDKYLTALVTMRREPI